MTCVVTSRNLKKCRHCLPIEKIRCGPLPHRLGLGKLLTPEVRSILDHCEVIDPHDTSSASVGRTDRFKFKLDEYANPPTSQKLTDVCHQPGKSPPGRLISWGPDEFRQRNNWISSRACVRRLPVVHRVSSIRLGPVPSSFRALSARLRFTARRHKFNKDSLLLKGPNSRLFLQAFPSAAIVFDPTFEGNDLY